MAQLAPGAEAAADDREADEAGILGIRLVEEPVAARLTLPGLRARIAVLRDGRRSPVAHW